MIRKARTVSPHPRGGMARSVVYNVFGADDTVYVIELTGEGKGCYRPVPTCNG